MQQHQRHTLGLVILLAVAFIWVGSAFLMNHMFANQDYNKSFAITYLNQASFSLYLLKIIFSKKRPANKKRIIDFNHALYDTGSRASSESLPRPSLAQDAPDQQFMYQSPKISDETTIFLRTNIGNSKLDRDAYIDPHDFLGSINEENKLKKSEVAKLCLIFCVLWFAANWSNNASLAYTNVASSTILASMSGFFTLGIGALAGTEQFSLTKLIIVSISVTGVILVSLADKTNMPINSPSTPTAPFFGDSLALIGAFLYSCNIVLLKHRIGDESRVDMSLFFGFVGIFTLVLLWPGFWLLDISGIEKFMLPPNTVIWAMVTINALIGTFLSDYLWLLATFMTSPLVVTLGLSLTIPMALVGDVIYKGVKLSTQYWVGAMFVFLGFIAINLAAIRDQKLSKLSNLNDQDDFLHTLSSSTDEANTTASSSGMASSAVPRARRSNTSPPLSGELFKS
ncbi:hypothetical protein G9A89_015301 [Geosiphon pyriformis]|nr:hypothetical protein G9A89_015301 [Geosiphon pyriformis]